jgi:hypothetical protein
MQKLEKQEAKLKVRNTSLSLLQSSFLDRQRLKNALEGNSFTRVPGSWTNTENK